MMNNASHVSVSPLILLLGRLPYKLGLTKQIREVKEAVGIFRGISNEFIEKRTKEVKSTQTKERSSDIIQSLIYENMEAEKRNEKMDYSDQDLID